MGRLIIIYSEYIIIIITSFTEIYIFYLYTRAGCFCLGSLFRVANCTAERKQNEGNKQGRTCLAEAVPSCWPSTKAECFLIAGYFGPINQRRTCRNGAVMVWKAERGKE